MTYQPSVSDEDARRLRAWHETAYQSMRAAGETVVTYLGREFLVPPQVFPPAATSELLGKAVLAEVRETDRVLDMGTGSGVNAVLAASRSRDVVGVDVNPHAVAAAAANAVRNGVGDRVSVLESDVFDAVSGRFDLIVFDPPFRWFAARDLLEVSIADENYRALTRFVTEADAYLAEGGRILMFFGTSGDLGYLYRLLDGSGFAREIVASRDFAKDGMTVTYHALRVVRAA